MAKDATTPTGNNDKTPGKIDTFAAAKADAVSPIVNKQPVYLPSFGGSAVPCSVVFSQSYEVEDTEPVLSKKPVYKVNDKGEKVFTDVETDDEDAAGNPIILRKYEIEGYKTSTSRVKTGGKSKVEWDFPVLFQTSNPDDLRKKIGESFELLRQRILQGDKIGQKSKLYHVTVKIGGTVVSTTSITDGGAKLSRSFQKGHLKTDLYRDNFCKVLWNQLNKVKDLATGKPLIVSDEILQAVGLK